jgi:hypothetical protein
MDLMLKCHSATDINFKLPEAAMLLTARIFLQICNDEEHIPEVKIFNLFY